MRVCYLSSMKNNKETFWSKAIAGLSANSTDAEFSQQVAANVFLIRFEECGGYANPTAFKRAHKATRWMTGYDEDFWTMVYAEFFATFGCYPRK